MKAKFFFVACMWFAFAAPGWALSGGPWDHLNRNAFSRNNPDGLYEASVTMPDGSGFIKFEQNSDLVTLDAAEIDNFGSSQSGIFGGSSTSVDITSTVATRTNSLIYYQGQAYFGNTYGSVSLTSNTVSGTGSGTAALVEDLGARLQEFAEDQDAIVALDDIRESFNMNFQGKITDKYPQVRFSAKGEVSFVIPPDLTFTTLPSDVLVIGSTGNFRVDAEERIRLFGRRVSVTPTSNNPLGGVSLP